MNIKKNVYFENGLWENIVTGTKQSSYVLKHKDIYQL